MLLTNRLTRLVATVVVATLTVAALITFAFSNDAIGDGDPRAEAGAGRPSVSTQPATEAPGAVGVTAEAAPVASPEPTEAAEPVAQPEAASGTSSPRDDDRPSASPTSPAPTAAPTTPAPPAPTPPPAPRQCYLLILPIACS